MSNTKDPSIYLPKKLLKYGKFLETTCPSKMNEKKLHRQSSLKSAKRFFKRHRYALANAPSNEIEYTRELVRMPGSFPLKANAIEENKTQLMTSSYQKQPIGRIDANPFEVQQSESYITRVWQSCRRRNELSLCKDAQGQLTNWRS